MGRRKTERIELQFNHLDLLKSFHNHIKHEHKLDTLYDYSYLYEYDKRYGSSAENDDNNFSSYIKSLNRIKKCQERLYGKHSKTKRIKSLKKKKSLHNTINQIYDEYNLMDSKRIIYYYPDLYDAYNNIPFESMTLFLQYLDEEGISINQEEINKILLQDVSHTCIDPIRRKDGNLFIKSERSYGELRFECAESEEDLMITYSKK